MKRMNRILALLLALALVLSLAACASGTEAPANGVEGPAADPKKSGTASGKEEFAPETAAPAAAPDLDRAEIAGDAEYFSKDGLSEDAAAGSRDPEREPMEAPAASLAGESLADKAPGDDDPIVIDDPIIDYSEQNVAGLVLTAAEWKDNDNWPFFTNLVNAGTIRFPSFGLDPRNRIAVTVTDEAEAPQVNAAVSLVDAEGAVLWTARTDKTGTAYLFFAEGQTPEKAVCGEAEAPVQVPAESDDPQGKAEMRALEAVTLRVSEPAPAQQGLQVMFIVDTTGSMGDEIAYLQKDFSAIAQRVGSEGVRYAVSFYRDQGDEYVTRHNGFTADVAEVQRKINAEYAEGGGDIPEAVAQVLTECLTDRTDWEEGCAKVAFLIFDAPPHDGHDEVLRTAARAAAEKGIHLVPVVASNAERETELFGRALAILTNGTYVFLTDDSGVGDSHLEPIVGSYTVELLQDLIVRIIESYRP